MYKENYLKPGIKVLVIDDYLMNDTSTIPGDEDDQDPAAKINTDAAQWEGNEPAGNSSSAENDNAWE